MVTQWDKYENMMDVMRRIMEELVDRKWCAEFLQFFHGGGLGLIYVKDLPPSLTGKIMLFTNFTFILEGPQGMRDYCGDCLALRHRTCSLHQTWKWLHQTIDIHNHMISLASIATQA